VNDPKARRRMAQEVTNLKVLHSAGGKVPRVLDGNTEQFENPNIPLFFVMDFIPGRTLADTIDSSGASLEKAIGITLDLCATVKIAAKEGIVHRDIKPENIIIRAMEPPDVVMVDFGLSFNEDDDASLTSVDEALDNKFLSLPERRGPGENKRDFRSDLTGLCAVLFYCLTGCSPRNLRDSQGRPPHRWPDFLLTTKIQNPVKLSFTNALLDVGLSYELDQRFQTADQLLTRLGEILHSPAEIPIDDIETIASRASAMLRRSDRKTQIAEYAQNVSAVRNDFISQIEAIRSRLAKYKQFELHSDEFVRGVNTPPVSGDGILEGQILVSIKSHTLRHQIVYRLIAEGQECVLYRQINEIVTPLPMLHALPGMPPTIMKEGAAVVVFRYLGENQPDVILWAKDIEAAVAKSIALLSERVQSGYDAAPNSGPFGIQR
jgi:serine/threonine protein kinase